ncbi:MAG: xanthine dehydrogenase family protein subunit M [bacterium]|nr:xanthine dehydrogenase family protein subunit M [bacterium]MDE0351326.1 xanthine dehydrogenase family protein subunit M [bacterium]
MRPADFEFRSAGTVDEAIAALSGENGTMALAGGQSLIPMMRFRLIRPSVVVDIGRIEGLGSIGSSDGLLEVGALVTTARLARSATVRSLSPLWAETASAIADPLVRNLGTVGGNLAHADPLNDLPAALVAARGQVIVVGPSGARTVSSDDLFVGPFETSLRRGELITGIRLPRGSGGAYEKMKRAAADYGVAAVAVQLAMDDGGRITQAGIAVTGGADVAARAAEAEDLLVGSDPRPSTIARAASATAASALMVTDDRGSARYKRELVKALAGRAIERATNRGDGT